MFGSLGGALSLYLGCAVVMLFELVELVIDIGIGLWKSAKNRVKNHEDNLQKKIESVEKGISCTNLTMSSSYYEAEFDKFVLVSH